MGVSDHIADSQFILERVLILFEGNLQMFEANMENLHKQRFAIQKRLYRYYMEKYQGFSMILHLDNNQPK